MKVYWVFYHNNEEEWGCVVVAQTARQAKVVFHRDNPMAGCDDESYIDIRARQAKDIVIPAEITEPTLFDGCDHRSWMCDLWRYDDRGCEGCENEVAKYVADQAGKVGWWDE